jgi:short-subunit dehydrogenase
MPESPRSSAPDTRPLALVTGASAGIGLCFAERLAEQGHDLILVARRRDRLEDLARRLGADCGADVEVQPADLTDPAELRKIEDRITAEPRLSLLVNNAGFGTVGRFQDVEPDRIESEIRLNVLALARLARAAVGPMVERGAGAIINVSSGAGFQPGPWFANYSATKAFVTSLSEAMAGELEGTGVRVQALCPGPVTTEFAEVAGGDEESVPDFLVQTPEQVVDASLTALEKDQVVCATSTFVGVSAALTSLLPRGISRRLGLALARRTFDRG